MKHLLNCKLVIIVLFHFVILSFTVNGYLHQHFTATALKLLINKSFKNDDQNCNYCTHICYYSQSKEINCSNEILGSMYPGQTLQTNLCNLCTDDANTVLYAEENNINLPSSACKVAQQS